MFCKIILPNNEIHVIQSIPKSFDELYQLIQKKFQNQLPPNFSLKYKDSDDELVLLLNDDDLKTAILTIENEKLRNLRIVIVPDSKSRNGDQKGKTQSQRESPQKDQDLRSSTFGRSEINHIPLTQSITELPSDLTGSDATTQKEDNTIDLNQPWKEIAAGSESISQFLSPIDKRGLPSANSRGTFFEKQTSLSNEENNDNAEKLNENLFSQDQMRIISDIIEKNINKHLFSKLENILSEAVMGSSGSLKSSMTRNGYPIMSSLSYTNLPAPQGPQAMRLSVKRCKELVDTSDTICNECKHKIRDIRYNCLHCKDYNCCEKCENSTEHPHPLLKIRITKSSPEGAHADNPATTLPADSSHPDSRGSLKPENQVLNRSRTVTNVPLDPHGTLEVHKGAKSHTIAHVPRPMETCDVKEFLRYKVAIVKEPVYDVIRVKAHHDYTVDFTIKNAGVNKWTNRVSLMCINGIHKGDEQELPSLAPGQEYVVSLYLTAPAECGRFLSQWQFHSFDENVGKPFGKPIYIEIDVSPGTKENKEQHQPKTHNEQVKKEPIHFHNGEKKEIRPVHKEGGRQNDGDVNNKDLELMKGLMIYCYMFN